MKEESKYYTPAIEDLFIGYECEELFLSEYSSGVLSYKETTLTQNSLIQLLDGLDDIPLFAAVRTPYLTKEQIEAEGLELPYLYICDFWIEEGIPRLEIYDLYGEQPKYYYQGKCPSINEFRKIIKLLDI